ncbi:hypothetical protein [Stenotrophomonas sp.]|uniref:hypothetical protein n=1 Tax=Stenotrophomonas sp. TaxID=69392 RepID=UPI00289FF2EB|nr:hypothetical protein [Stenotrophomonas sp.]
MERFGIVCLITSALLAGCTTSLRSDHVYLDTKPGPGIVYSLPRATFDAEVVFFVTGCTRNPGQDITLEYELRSATIRQYLTPDPAEIHRIPYNELNASTKATALDIVMHPSGMIKSINSQVDDRTAQVTSAIAGTVLNLAQGYVSALSPTSIMSSCDADLARVLERRAELLRSIQVAESNDGVLKNAQKRIDETSDKLNLALSELDEANASKNAVLIQRLKGEVAKLKAGLKTLQGNIKGKELTAPPLVAELATIESALSLKAMVSAWTPTATTPATRLSVPQSEFVRSFRTAIQKPVNFQVTGNFVANLMVQVESSPKRPESMRSETGGSGTTGQGYSGLVYRQPAVGTIKVSTGYTSLPSSHQGGVSLPQFGTKGSLWLRNRAFDKNSVVAEFNADGSLVNMSFKSDAQAERAALAAQELSGTLADLMKIRLEIVSAQASAESEAERKARQSELDSIDHQINVVTRQRTLADAVQPSKDPLDVERDMLKKQIEVEKLRRELALILGGGAQ